MYRIRKVRHYMKSYKGNIEKILGNPIVIGAIAGIARNITKGKPPIDVEKIKSQVTQPNATNPLLLLGAGLLLRNKALQAIGAFLIVDPPEEEPQKEISLNVETPVYIPPKPSVIVKTQ